MASKEGTIKAGKLFVIYKLTLLMASLPSVSDLARKLRRYINAYSANARNRPVVAVLTLLGSDRSCGYCLEMICAHFPAGANLGNGDPEPRLFSIRGSSTFCPESRGMHFLETSARRPHDSGWHTLPARVEDQFEPISGRT